MTANNVPKVRLNNGTLIPMIGLGTWGSDWGVTFGVSRKLIYLICCIVDLIVLSNEIEEQSNRLLKMQSTWDICISIQRLFMIQKLKSVMQ